MSRRLAVAVAAAALLWTLPAAAQVMESEHLIPVVASTTGAGDPPTRWVTDLVVMNPYDRPLGVGLMYFPWGADRVTEWDSSYPVTFSLAAQETLMIEDVLGTRFGYATATKGTLLVSCSDDVVPGNPEDAKMMATSRTYNTGSAAGTYGQTVLPVDLYVNGSFEPSYVLGARHDARFRSNLGMMNVSPEEIVVHYRIRGADGTVLVEGSKTLELFNGGQWGFDALGLAPTAGALRVELWLDPGDVTPDPCAVEWNNGFVAYVSKVDGNPSGTGDAEFLPAIPDDFPPADWLCPDDD